MCLWTLAAAHALVVCYLFTFFFGYSICIYNRNQQTYQQLINLSMYRHAYIYMLKHRSSSSLPSSSSSQSLSAATGRSGDFAGFSRKVCCWCKRQRPGPKWKQLKGRSKSHHWFYKLVVFWIYKSERGAHWPMAQRKVTNLASAEFLTRSGISRVLKYIYIYTYIQICQYIIIHESLSMNYEKL